MKLVITEKNIAAKKLAEILATGKPKADKVYNTPVYRFTRDGDEWVAIGLKGHILGVEFPLSLSYHDSRWTAEWEDAPATNAAIPERLPVPPWPKKGRPYTASGIDLKTWKLASLPYLVWAPVGKAPAEKEIIRSLKSLAKKAEDVVIATDFDREGELIGSDARGIVLAANPKLGVTRARYSAITKDEIESAFANLTAVDDCLAQAGESRQDIDLVWGAVLTRYLTMSRFSGYGNVRSAGRVQTPTLAIVVEREREREAFVPETYWQIKGSFAAGEATFSADHSGNNFSDGDAARRASDAVADAREGRVVSVEKKRRQQAPPTPFNTTELQVAASREGMTPKRAMSVAESLYMNGLISYPRVDNTVYPPSLDLAGILTTLSSVPEYRPHAKAILAAPLHPTRGKKETTDHPPIHPTGAADLDKLKPEERKIYNLVARRFMATMSGPATVEGTRIGIDVATGGAEPERFVAKGDVLVDPGFKAVYPYGQKKDEQLPALEEGSIVEFSGAELLEKQTEPSARYSQGTLIQEMEKRGLGTKATRHAIIDRLYEVRYVEGDDGGRNIRPTKLGHGVVDALSQFAPRITSPVMTVELESEMDDIANGRISRDTVVSHSRELLAGVMDDLIAHVDGIGEALKDAVAADAKVGVCPKSGHDLLVKSSPKTRSMFVGCSGWPECDVTYPLPQGKIEAVDEACATCGTPQVRVIQFRQKPMVRCLDPECPTNHEPTVDVGACAACEAAGKEGRLIAQRNPKTLKRFVRCTNHEECQTSYPLPQRGEIEPTGERCAACGAPEVVIRTTRGPWRICVDPNCPSKAEAAEKKAKSGSKTGSKAGGRKRTSKRSG